MVNVMEKSVEIDFKHSVMSELPDVVQNALRLILLRNLHEDSLMVKGFDKAACQKSPGSVEKKFIPDVEHIGIRVKVRTEENNTVNGVGTDDLLDVDIEHLANQIITVNVGDYQGTVHILVGGLLFQKPESMFGQGGKILIMTVTDNQAVVYASFNFVPWFHHITRSE